jgi:predicted outer membrane protein
MRRFGFLLPLILFLALAARVLADGTKPLEFKKPPVSNDLGEREMAFLTNANAHGVLMHYLAELAKTNGESPSARELGEKFATAQDEETNRLIELASGKGLSFKAQFPPSIRKIHVRLTPLTGPAFDKACLAELAALARAIVINYEFGTQCQDAEIKSFAEEGAPLARERLETANKVAGSDKAVSNTINRIPKDDQ